jgi:hypothetical protein
MLRYWYVVKENNNTGGSAMLRVLVLICMTIGLTVPVMAEPPAAQCNSGKLQLPNLDSVKLPDGDQVVAAIETEHGKLEARVKVKEGDVSDLTYSIRGKLLAETPESKVPKAVRACWNNKRAAAGPTWSASIMDLIISPAEAKLRCIARVVGSGCDDTICCARACCGNKCATWCSAI